MEYNLLNSAEDISCCDSKFMALIRSYFSKNGFVFVDFGENILKINVFYCEKIGLWISQFRNEYDLKYAIGRFNKVNFVRSKNKKYCLEPLFLFEFSFDDDVNKYDAVFVKDGLNTHIMSKLFHLSSKDIVFLKNEKNYPLCEYNNYILFDWGNIEHKDRFLNNLISYCENIDFRIVENQLTITY